MAQRGRTRNAGLPDSNIAETVPYPIVPAWVSGRFYSGSLHNAAVGTLALGTSAYFMPIIVPKPVTVTSIGIEVSGAGGAGSLARLAIYTDRESRPDELVIDAGTVAVDGVAYQSAVISQVLQAGPYWTALANKTVTSAATVRAFPSTFSHSITAASVGTVTGTGVIYVLVNNNPASGGIVDTGWPQKAFFGDSSVYLTSGAGSPRVMLGV